MSWFGRENPLRSSFNRRRSSRFMPFQKVNESTCLEVFKTHWQQAWGIMAKYENGYHPNLTLVDDVRSVENLLDQMTTLLLQEAQHSDDGEKRVVIGPILSFFLSDECLEKLFNWSLYTGEYMDVLKLVQLRLYEVLVSNCHQDLLFHKPVVRPLLRLLSSCRECCPVEVEKRLVILLNALCVCITQFPDLLQVFFHASSDQGGKRSAEMFLIFSLLIPFVHREGGIGQQARDALLLCMSLSRKNESIGLYVAEHSNFCPILATGLSGLYSLLPRKLQISCEDWHCFTTDDIAHMPELGMFLNSLEFCNAVIQVAHPMVQEQLLEYLYQGFLIPVLGPALHQNTLEEIIATTAYLELFLRTITEPILLQVFLKFLLTSSHEGRCILNTLIDRLGAQGQLCLVTMALFHHLLDMNCEDVLFQLVLRFLVPCSHIMVSQRSRIRDLDIYSLSADKFLSLIPNCCLPSNQVDASVPMSVSGQFVPGHTLPYKLSSYRGGSLRVTRHRRIPSSSSFSLGEYDQNYFAEFHPEKQSNSSYLDYLRQMHDHVLNCSLSCRSWSAPYDGCDPPPELPPKPAVSTSSTNEAMLNGFSHTLHNKRTESKTVDLNIARTSIPSSTTVNNLPVSKKGNEIKQTPDDKEPSMTLEQHDTKDDNSGENILNQLICTEDENTFWSLINSTKTPSSLSDLDDSLEPVDMDKKEVVDVKNNNYDKAVDAPCPKESSSNLDSGVFGSRDSNSSSDRDNDSEVAIQSKTGAKVRHVSDNLLPRKITGTKLDNPYTSTWEVFSQSPNVGPFLSILLTRLEMMMQNDVYTNLHLTGLLSRLACYPQPLLRSFLLNQSLVFQPTVRSLIQVLGSLKHKVDSYACTVENFDELVSRSRQFLAAREDFMQSSSTRMYSPKPRHSSLLHRGDSRRRSFSNILRRASLFGGKANAHLKESRLEPISDNHGYRYYAKMDVDELEGEMESIKTKNAVLCAVVLEEFLKEIAAISEEHSLIQLDPDFWDNRWQLAL